jgi:hypothetical protein
MDAAGLRAWQRRMRFTDAAAAEAVGLSVSGYSKQRRGVSPVGRQTALLCDYVEALGRDWLPIAAAATHLARLANPGRQKSRIPDT